MGALYARTALLILFIFVFIFVPAASGQSALIETDNNRIPETYTEASHSDAGSLIERVRHQAMLFLLADVPGSGQLTRHSLNMQMSLSELEASVALLEQLWQSQGLRPSVNNAMNGAGRHNEVKPLQAVVHEGVIYDAVIYEGVDSETAANELAVNNNDGQIIASKNEPFATQGEPLAVENRLPTSSANPEQVVPSLENLKLRLDTLEAEPSFGALIGELRHLTQLAARPWEVLELSVSLRPGDESVGLEFLRRRLVELGDLPVMDDVITGRYEGALVTAVKYFQRRHGLAEDGVVGPKTLKWLNMPPQQRAERLARGYLKKNRESRDLPSTYLLVNIPQFWLELVDAGQQVLGSRVIVGRVSRPTPLIEGMISAVVVNPSWRVPRKLIRQDILPKVRFNGAYLAKKGFTVSRADGSVVYGTPAFFEQAAAGQFPYNLVQSPGPHNSLGRFKLHFDNNDSVYLHDTPERNLFNKADRALSSGCIRVEKIAEIADWFASSRLNDHARWERSLANSRTTRWFPVRQQVPVKFVYWTSWIDANGESQFREDIYAIDR